MQKKEYPKKKRPREGKTSRGLINLERKKNGTLPLLTKIGKSNGRSVRPKTEN